MNVIETATPVVQRPRLAGFDWPHDFVRVPDEAWASSPLDDFGVRYHQVGAHGYYKNLDPIAAQVAVAARDGQVVVDYSGGTGLLTGRLLETVPARIGIVNVDPSAKFLRVAVEHYAGDERVAFRLLGFVREERRLETLDEVLGSVLADGGIDIIAAANAVHLYPDLLATMRSWHRALRPGGLVLINSGCLRNPDARPDDWVLDDTIDKLNEIVVGLVLREPAFARYRENVVDEARWSAYEAARHKVFVPVRPLQTYVDALVATGFDVVQVTDSTIFVNVDQFFDLLSIYHESVLGWVGGTHKVGGRRPTEQAVRDRLFLIRYGLDRMFPTAREFPCNWTYLTCRRGG